MRLLCGQNDIDTLNTYFANWFLIKNKRIVVYYLNKSFLVFAEIFLALNGLAIHIRTCIINRLAQWRYRLSDQY